MKKVSELINNYSKIIRSFKKDESVLFWFIEDITGLSKSQLFMRENVDIDESKLSKMVKLYCDGKSAQYILGYSYFYGRKFIVNENVLIPRYETEEVVEVAIKIIKDNNLFKVCDLGCGSGVIAITIACECSVNVDAVDISSEALEVAKLNNNTYNSKVNFYEGNMVDPIIHKDYDIIVSNPPYIPTSGYVDKETLENEPSLALFGGDDGLDFYRMIISKCSCFKSLKYIVFEIGYNQGSLIKKLTNKKVEIIKDINNNDRIAIIYLKEE